METLETIAGKNYAYYDTSPAEIQKFNTAAVFFLALMCRVHVKYHIFDDARAPFFAVSKQILFFRGLIMPYTEYLSKTPDCCRLRRLAFAKMMVT